MFIWNKKLYMDEKVAKKPGRYRRIISEKKIVKKCYCITLPENQQNCMDIYDSREFWFKYRRQMGLEIIGMAADRESAFELVGKIAEDILNEYGELNPMRVHEFFGVHD